jgi:hypothetical protein
LDDGKRLRSASGTAYASIVENYNLESGGQFTDKPWFPQVHGAAVPHDQEKGITASENPIAHADIGNIDRTFGLA